jgi:ribosome biogenesis protein BRX1
VVSLVEIGPRFVLNPIRVFSGSFGGPTLYQNPKYVSPNLARAERKMAHGNKYAHRVREEEARKAKKARNVIPKGPLTDLFKIKT